MAKKFQWIESSRSNWHSDREPLDDRLYAVLGIGCLQRIANSLESIQRQLQQEFAHERAQFWQRRRAEREVLRSAVDDLFAPFEEAMEGDAFIAFDRVRTLMARDYERRLSDRRLAEMLREIIATDLRTLDVRQFGGVGVVLASNWRKHVLPALAAKKAGA